MAEETKSLTPQEMLCEVDNAIYTILIGGQSYKIGSRQMTRADIAELRKMKNELTGQIALQGSSSLLDGTYVANFEGR